MPKFTKATPTRAMKGDKGDEPKENQGKPLSTYLGVKTDMLAGRSVDRPKRDARPTSSRKQDKEVDGSSGIRMDVYYPGTNEDAVENIKAGRSSTHAKNKKGRPVKHRKDRMFEGGDRTGSIEFGTKRKRSVSNY